MKKISKSYNNVLENLNSNSPYHIFIIWNKSLIKKNEIIHDVKNKFELKNIFEMNWSQNLFLDNLKRFYGATLPNPEKKLKDCGTGTFLIILVQDKNPVYRENGTGLEKKLVNGNVFDAKMTYRKWLGRNFAVHGSNTQQETNHDLSLLFGKSLDEMISDLKSQDNQIIKISRDIVGAKDWSSLKELFHIINNSTNYVILRNFENLIDPSEIDNQKDIDILTDDFWQISYIVNKKIRNEGELGPSSYVKINNKRIKFDFKTPGDGYYDKNWEKNILKNKVLFNNQFYIPDEKNYFFTLLYHVLIHKKNISDKNFIKLKQLSENLKINNFPKSNDDPKRFKKILDEFLKTNNYSNTHTINYKLKNPYFIKQIKISLKIIKKQGIRKFLRVINDKLYRKKLIKSGKI